MKRHLLTCYRVRVVVTVADQFERRVSRRVACVMTGHDVAEASAKAREVFGLHSGVVSVEVVDVDDLHPAAMHDKTSPDARWLTARTLVVDPQPDPVVYERRKKPRRQESAA